MYIAVPAAHCPALYSSPSQRTLPTNGKQDGGGRSEYSGLFRGGSGSSESAGSAGPLWRDGGSQDWEPGPGLWPRAASVAAAVAAAAATAAAGGVGLRWVPGDPGGSGGPAVRPLAVPRLRPTRRRRGGPGLPALPRPRPGLGPPSGPRQLAARRGGAGRARPPRPTRALPLASWRGRGRHGAQARAGDARRASGARWSFLSSPWGPERGRRAPAWPG